MNSKLILVLKDNAYGFGLFEMLQVAKKHKLNIFAVKELVEADIIKREISDARIIILGNKISLNKDYEYTICNESDYKYCKDNNLKYHIKLNLGMNRFGMNELNMEYALDDLCKGVYFHSPNKNRRDNQKMLKEFDTIVKTIGREELIYHIGGSCYLDMSHSYYVRTGIAMYENSYSFYGNILEIREVKKGETVGYTNKFKAKKDISVAICDIGYVNGLSRQNKNNYVYINNNKYKLIGVKCMDFCFIRVDNRVKKDDRVLFIGHNIREYCRKNKVTKYEIYLNYK